MPSRAYSSHTALKRILLSSTRRKRSTLPQACAVSAGPNGSAAVAKSTLADNSAGAIRRRPWEKAVLESCASRKQVRVSLESVLAVSTGAKPWRSSFGEANPEVQPGAEPEFARPACNSYWSDAERRRMAEGQIQSAQYLHRELPVRLAYAVSELEKMKDTGLNDTHPVELVRESYLESFRELQETQKPHDRHSVAAFTETVQRAHKRGENTVVLMACGLQDLTRDAGGSGERNELEHGEGPLGSHDEAHLKRVQDFLDNFYQNRVAMRFLCGHYLALSLPQRAGFVGLVQRGVSLVEIAQTAAVDAATICCHALGTCPEVRMTVDASGDGLVAGVPEYVHYVLLELLKNAMRATMQAHGSGNGGDNGDRAGGKLVKTMDVAVEEDMRVQARTDGDDGGDTPITFAEVPAVNISVSADGEADVLLTVADQGGGIPEKATDKVWSYLYTTAGHAVRKAYLANGGNPSSGHAPLAGLGYGLPLSRLYARNFGGELKLQTEVGKGTAATLRLSRFGTRLEPLVWPRAVDDFHQGDSHVHL